MMATLNLGYAPSTGVFNVVMSSKGSPNRVQSFSTTTTCNGGDNGGGEFPSFLPKEVEKIKDPFARSLARRIVRLPVQMGSSENYIMSSCIKPLTKTKSNPVVLLHCFDSSCLEWRCTYPLLEEAGLEAWAVDVLGWGFSDLEIRPSCDVASKRHHLYQFWKEYIKRPMILVGPSLGASVAIDFTVNYPDAVEKLVVINPSVYAEGTKHLAKLPKTVAYAGVSFLQSLPLRFYGNLIAFNGIPFHTILDWTNVGRLHCLLPWWKDATISFMFSGGYNVISQIKQVKKKTLIINGELDQIVSYKLVVQLHSELSDAIIRQIADTGHLPHVDKPDSVAKLIVDFVCDQLPRNQMLNAAMLQSSRACVISK
ncbi:alpha/beta hydrolase domain-containing protein VTE7 [Mercurialis annua]|uniref:alpha/beta hydrolase domain-containing protein VTE7 n=1 Tax=Mercurialis annua TaxID=3986 RepID=UPI00215E1798|nr:alpha/beta hydrolase domain-containing protein VTE7 [Mercurialis annua]XP_055961614.1 alpha/beta hydrolase domain-containing protein VTE7 [Mercurialis annua]